MKLSSYGFFWIPCDAHCIDLILKDFSKRKLVSRVVEKARMIITFIYNHGKVLALMRRMCNGELVRPGITRFATNFIALRSLKQHKTGLKTMCYQGEWFEIPEARTEGGRKVEILINDISFWDDVTQVTRIMDPVVSTLQIVDGDKKPTMGVIYEAMRCMREKVREAVGKLSKAWLDIIDERWSKMLSHPLHKTAYYFNPKYQYKNGLGTNADLLAAVQIVVEKLVKDEKLQILCMNEVKYFRDALGSFGRITAINGWAILFLSLCNFLFPFSYSCNLPPYHPQPWPLPHPTPVSPKPIGKPFPSRTHRRNPAPPPPITHRRPPVPVPPPGPPRPPPAPVLPPRPSRLTRTVPYRPSRLARTSPIAPCAHGTLTNHRASPLASGSVHRATRLATRLALSSCASRLLPRRCFIAFLPDSRPEACHQTAGSSGVCRPSAPRPPRPCAPNHPDPRARVRPVVQAPAPPCAQQTWPSIPGPVLTISLRDSEMDCNEILSWPDEDDYLRTKCGDEIAHCLWDEINQDENSLLYMLGEQTPAKESMDLGYRVFDSGGSLEKSFEDCRPTSFVKRRRMLQFDPGVGDIMNGNDGITSIASSKVREEYSLLSNELSENLNLASELTGLTEPLGDWWPHGCLNDKDLLYSCDEMLSFGPSDDHIVISENSNSLAEVENPKIVTPLRIKFKARKSLLKAPTTPSSVAYPFELVKPSGMQGDVTLTDINRRIHSPPPPKLPCIKQKAPAICYPTSAISGKPVVAKTKIRTEGGRGSITITRTKG